MTALQMRDLLVYAILVYVSFYVLKTYNIIGNRRGVDKSKHMAQAEKTLHKKQKVISFLLEQAKVFAMSVGGELSLREEVEVQYRIDRRNIQSKLLKRRLTPMELTGIFRFVSFLGAVLTVVGLLVFHNPLAVVFLAGLVVKPIAIFFLDGKIAAEDAELEQQFPDLYLLLYSRLIRGANTRLAPTLTEYLVSLDTIGEDENTAIRSFVKELRSNIEVYSDDQLAVAKLRNKYRSAMIINFVNLATQALSGVDNRDKLTSFKDELTTRKMKQMQERAEKLVAKGRKSIVVVYIILFEFVIISWVSKLGPSLSSFGNMF